MLWGMAINLVWKSDKKAPWNTVKSVQRVVLVSADGGNRTSEVEGNEPLVFFVFLVYAHLFECSLSDSLSDSLYGRGGGGLRR